MKVHTFQIFYTTVPDPCNSGPCDTNAECARDSVLNSDFTCTCTSPFEGDGFTCESRYFNFMITHISDLLYHSA